MFTAAYVGNRAPHSALNMQSPYKMLTGTEPDVRILRVIEARAFVHIERRTKKPALKAVEGRLVGYSSSSKSYCVYNLVTRCNGKQERHLYRDAVAPTSATFRGASTFNARASAWG